jgi:hypothetical protein
VLPQFILRAGRFLWLFRHVFTASRCFDMNPFWKVADFVRSLRREIRFGQLSRAPLRLLRLELLEKTVVCDWVARPPDTWDASLQQPVRDRNESQQALADAISIRDLIFHALPDLDLAVLRAFRQSAREPPELIIVGSICRDDPGIHQQASLVMQAKLSGFRFSLQDGRLQSMSFEDFEMSFGQGATPEYAVK